MTRRDSIALLAAGSKGLIACRSARKYADVETIFTYEPRGTSEPGPEHYRRAFPDIEIRVGRTPDLAARCKDVDIIFIAGWQFLVTSLPKAPTVVLHDSLLPDLRGFAPTVTALILGRSQLGVSAILPAAEPDTGDLITQHAVDVSHPLRISDALDALEPAYATCIREVLQQAKKGPLVGQPQDETRATHSIWRDDDDYWLNFCDSADQVKRTVLALGAPYSGARSVFDGQVVTIHDAEVETDVEFAIRQPGKIWNVGTSGPLVVCGSGMIRLSDVRDQHGAPIIFTLLRKRFGSPMQSFNGRISQSDSKQ